MNFLWRSQICIEDTEPVHVSKMFIIILVATQHPTILLNHKLLPLTLKLGTRILFSLSFILQFQRDNPTFAQIKAKTKPNA